MKKVLLLTAVVILAVSALAHLSGHPKPANEGHLKTGQRE